MQKDEYAMMKARQEIVKAFIDKLESASMGDVNIIPALMDYIQTGNREMFEDYRLYLETTTVEQRIEKAKLSATRAENLAKEAADYAEKQIEWHTERKKRANERYREIDEELQNINQTIEEKQKAYEEKMQAYRHRMNELREAENSDITFTEDMSMQNLRDFCDKVITDGKYADKVRKLWALKAGKLYCVKGFSVLDSGKAVFSIDDDSVIPPKP
jgi:chromosome segregation ATPase